MIKNQKLVIQEIEDLKDEFSYLETPIEKMQFIIDLGKEHSNDESIISNENEIPGCVSKAYVDIKKDETILISFYADAVIIQGFLAIITDLLNNTSADELDKNISLIEQFSSDVELQSFLSPNRSNALFNIFKKLKE